MSSAKSVVLSLSFCCCLLAASPASRAQTCAPSADGAGCMPLACSPIPEDRCLARAMQLDAATGAIRVAVCECMDFNLCHIEFGNASPFPVGGCLDGGVCRVLGADTDGDGIEDEFLATCVPLPPPTCCVDISDGPIPFETCMPVDLHTCNGLGGLFFDSAGGCDNVQACCLGPFGANLCADLNPACCFESGGLPQGPGSTCASATGAITCPQACGGIAGIPCADPDAFCKFPVGACCCDFMGVCAPRPIVCPDVWDPVCGCDGVTYGNECEADMAGAVIEHTGTCAGACCLSTAAGVIACIITDREICAAEGGVYQGDGTVCPADASIACGTPTGACCHATPGTTVSGCSIRTEAECLAGGGAYKGNGTECPSDPNLLCGEPLGACCSDVSGVPVPLPFCSNTTREQCVLGGGLFAGPGSTCEVTEACCLTFGGNNTCLDINPMCCREFGGVPQGPGASCLDPTGALTCPTVCGGIAGIPCPGDNEFCRLPDGGCCCDSLGICTPFPTVCPDVWDPVCGCDGVTYGNRCEASAVGVSVDHRGECMTGACCLADAAGNVACFITTREVCQTQAGAYQGNGTTCPTDATAPCAAPTGACCLGGPLTPMHPACIQATEARCGLEGGSYRGDGTVCPDDPTLLCGPPEAACCLPEGICLTLPMDVCLGANGRWHPGALCELIDCPVVPKGACCVGVAGAIVPGCLIATEAECLGTGGTYLGDNTPCPPDGTLACPLPTGACCAIDPATGVLECKIATAPECLAAGGEYRGDGTVCPTDSTQLCDIQASACCLPNGNCFNIPVAVCLIEGGSPRPGLTCDQVACPAVPRGACCVNILGGPGPGCLIVTEAECLGAGGTYLGDNTPCPTDANLPCPFPTGACCVRDPATGVVFCRIATAPECAAEGGEYRGDGTACPANPDSLCGINAGACCLPSGACFNLPIDVCLAEGGHPTPGVSCDVVFCPAPPTGACCVRRADGSTGCFVGTALDCERELGAYLGDDSRCPSDPTQSCGLPCDQVCPAGQVCFAGCGVLAQGTECVVFRADVGAVFLLGTQGGFTVGDRVRVSGCVDPTCATTCLEGNGCIAENTITSCQQVCGGIAGIPCDNPNEFCKFPDGTCDIADNQGVCTPIPTGGCPEIFAPVCGCDGVTYVNECESDAAGVSILHPGECQTFDCPATRAISDPHVAFCPPAPKTVKIVLVPPAGVTAVAVEDAPPGGWTVSEISDGGTFDSVNGKVKWGPFFAGAIPEFVSYVASPSNASVGPACFAGTVSLDGLNRPVCGDQCIDRRCCPRMAADRPGPACAACPGGDCNSCAGQACQDGRVSLCELISYACAWMRGCNDDLAGMTRSAFVWRNGECACWDPAAGNWFPTPCPGTASGCCGDSLPRDAAPGGVSAAAPSRSSATAHVTAIRKGAVTRMREVRVPITIEAPLGTSAVALEIDVPEGWQVTAISDGGQWDETNRKVKWGPLFDNLSRTVTFEARGKLVRSRSKPGRTGRPERYTGFSGTISFDGMNQPIAVE